MNQRDLKSLVAFAVLTGSLTLAPAAQAAESVNRNTGVGAQIAAQGNVALRYIRSTLHLAAPWLPKPARPHAEKVSAPAVPASGGAMLASGLRCAE